VDARGPLDVWFASARRNDKKQKQKWDAYFDMKMTPEQLEYAKNLQHRTVSSMSGLIDYIGILKEQNSLITQWAGKTPDNIDTKEDDRRMTLRTLSSSGRLKGFFPFSSVNDGIDEKHDPEPSSDPLEAILKRLQRLSTRKAHSTFLTEEGGLLKMHAHSIPALFIRPHLAALTNPNIDFHVLCHGFRFTAEQEEWGWSTVYNLMSEEFEEKPVRNEYELAALLLDSPALKKIRGTSTPKTLRRICIWLQTKEHVAMFCWDEYRLSSGRVHEFALCDNLGARTSFLDHQSFRYGFERALTERSIALDDEKDWSTHAFDPDYMKVQDDFLCTSYMARYTLISSMFEALLFAKTATQRKYAALDLGGLKMVYRQFEHDLFDFMKTKTKEKKIVLLSPSLDASFVDVNAISLVAMDVNGACASYFYAGSTRKFVARNASGGPERGCAISSRACGI
jgi:hypothetical protein